MRRGFQRDIFVREGGLREPEAVSEPRQRRVRVRRREQKCRRCFPGGLEGEVWLELKQLSSEPAQWQGGELRFRAGCWPMGCNPGRVRRTPFRGHVEFSNFFGVT